MGHEGVEAGPRVLVGDRVVDVVDARLVRRQEASCVACIKFTATTLSPHYAVRPCPEVGTERALDGP
jgi:hypothetical protein